MQPCKVRNGSNRQACNGSARTHGCHCHCHCHCHPVLVKPFRPVKAKDMGQWAPLDAATATQRSLLHCTRGGTAYSYPTGSMAQIGFAYGAHAPVRGPSPNASDPSLTRLSPANDTLAPRLVPPHDAAERLLVTRGGAGSPRCTGH